MDIRLENTIRIKALEEEFSDERIKKIFRTDEDMSIYISERQGRLTGRVIFQRVLVVIVIVVCLIVTVQFFSPRIVFDDSMEATIRYGDCIVIAKQAYTGEDVKHGEIVAHGSRIAEKNGGMRELYNRVIGLPGDKIEIKDGKVYRNGEMLGEPYVKNGMTEGIMTLSTVPEGYYFVLGDNRQISVDSRDGRVGFVSSDQIRGKVVWRLLPVSRFGGL